MSLMQEMNERALELGVPLGVHLDVTYRCNERCVHCYLDHDDRGELTTVEIKDILQQLAEAGTFFLTLSGGEVLMRRDFFEILEHARDLKFNVRIKTNGVMIRKSEARRMRDLGVEQVQVSIYSRRPEIHDAITKLPGALKRSIEAIRLLKSQGLKVAIANVLMTVNMGEHAGVQALAQELGVVYTLDPTITPKIDGDTEFANSGFGAEGGLPQQRFGGKCRRVLRASAKAGRRRHGRLSLQRRTYGGLHHSVWRCFPLCAIPAAEWQCAAAEVY